MENQCATHTQGYKQWKGFIIAQAPMNSTCRDFWKMVYERECGVIVMLSDLGGEWKGLRDLYRLTCFTMIVEHSPVCK